LLINILYGKLPSHGKTWNFPYSAIRMSHHRMTRANMFGHVRPLLDYSAKFLLDWRLTRSRYIANGSVELRINKSIIDFIYLINIQNY